MLAMKAPHFFFWPETVVSFLTYFFLERTGLQLREKQLCKYKYNVVALFKGAVFSPSLQQKGSKGFLFLLCILMDHTLRALDMQNMASTDALVLII